jgi:uncharacterized protein
MEVGGAAIGIVCKAPQPGRSKTRLAHAIGAAAACELSACFLRDVAAAIEAVPEMFGRRGYGVYAPAGTEDIMRQLLPPGFGLLLQAGDDLGHVLIGATRAFLSAGHDCMLLVNGDSPTLPPRLLTQAIEILRQPGDHMVLGPASDGGYYLIGLKHSHPQLFERIAWGTDSVARATCERAAEIGLATTSRPCAGCRRNCSAVRPAFVAADLPRRAAPSSRLRRRSVLERRCCMPAQKAGWHVQSTTCLRFSC